VAATEQLTPRIYLKIDGSDASEEVMDNVISIEVDDSLTLPDMFAIHLKDPNLKWIDADSFSLGKSVEISAKNGRAETKLILGEITGIEPHLNPATGPTLILRGYDKSHRLNRGKKTSSFVQMTDGDIAKKIAQNAGLKSKVDPTRQVHEYVLQENQTDWEFLISRAQRIGYHVLVKDGVLHFVKAPDGGGQAPILEWAVDLSQFNARLSTIHQVSEVVVQGWDPDRQQQIVGRATQARDIPQIGESRQGGEAAKDAFGVEAKEIIVNRPVATQAEADALAQSICDEIGQGFIEAECVCFGNPAVQAGAMVELQGLGDRFSGNYRITHALHRYDASGYTTEFTIGGRHATTIAELLSSRNGSNGSQPGVRSSYQ
jgi:phage protein D